MSDELRIPPVIDLEVLLQPISEENPSGESLRYSGIYDEITEARRADDTLNRGEWVTDLKVADYDRVVSVSLPALLTQTKDLQLGVWLTEALTYTKGLAGFRDGFRMLVGFHDSFWETFHPEIDEGDMEGRANALSWLDINCATALRTAAITGAKGYNFNDWEDSKKYDFPDNIDSLPSEEKTRWEALRSEAERERRVTAALWRVEKADTRRAAMEVISLTIEECDEALRELSRLVEEKYDRNQAPGFSNVQKILEEIRGQVKKILEEKRLEEPDEIEEEESETSENEAGVEGSTSTGTKSGSGGPIETRKDALKKLGEIAAFFQRTEPHSPVSYLVQRAVKWGNMGLETWLQEVIKDQSVLVQLRETLGVDDSGGASGSDDPWAQ